MKRFCIALLLFALVAAANSFGQKQDAHDGFWWSEKSESFKLGYVAGYVEAMVTSSNSPVWKCLAEKNGGTIPAEYPGRAMLEECGKAADPHFDYSGIPFGQLQEGVDHFYKDFRNKRININAAISYVRDQLRGKPADELDAALAFMRKNALAGGPELVLQLWGFCPCI